MHIETVKQFKMEFTIGMHIENAIQFKMHFDNAYWKRTCKMHTENTHWKRNTV